MYRVHARARAAARSIARLQERMPPAGAVALTFDDGPDPEFPPQVLDVLARHRVLATFFLVGRRVRSDPDLTRRIVATGHTVGSHSLTHPEVAQLSWHALAREYVIGRRVVEHAVGSRVRLFRPPKGHMDARSALIMRLGGLRPWLWSVDPADWQPGITAARILERVGTPGDGDVLLLHDGIESAVAASAADRSATVAALPGIIDAVHAAQLALRPLP
jgi:peptidoglycan-N-acetylglucosamine deacetylase